MTRDQVVDTARKYLGVPWVHQGRNKHGLDCVGVISIVAKDLGVIIIEDTNYSRYYRSERLMEKFTENTCEEIPLNRRLAGDIMVINVGKGPLHVGILSMKNGIEHIIHSRAVLSFVREEPVDFLMEKKFFSAFTFPGV